MFLLGKGARSLSLRLALSADTEMHPQAGDVELLADLGYKQEFKRSFNAIEVFGMGFSVIGLCPSMAYVGLNSVISLSLILCSAPFSFTQYRTVDLWPWSGGYIHYLLSVMV